MLDRMDVDIIEAGFAASSENDFKAIKEISKVVENSVVTSLSRCNKRDIDIAYEAIKDANKKRIHVNILVLIIPYCQKFSLLRVSDNCL